MDRGAWWAAVHGVAKSRIWLSNFTFTFPFMRWRRKWQPLQYSCLENPRDRGAWRAAIYGVTQSRTWLKWLSSSSSSSWHLECSTLTATSSRILNSSAGILRQINKIWFLPLIFSDILTFSWNIRYETLDLSKQSWRRPTNHLLIKINYPIIRE